MKKALVFVIAIFLFAVVSLRAQSLSWNLTGNTFPSLTFEDYFIGSTNQYPLFFRTDNTTRMCISIAGNVGVGTTAPKQMLHVVDGGMNTILLEKVEELTR